MRPGRLPYAILYLTDSRSMVKLQNIFHEYERSIQKVRSRHGYLADKVSQLEMERAELRSSLEEVKDVKSSLERNQLELQTEVTNLKWELHPTLSKARLLCCYFFSWSWSLLISLCLISYVIGCFMDLFGFVFWFLDLTWINVLHLV